MINTLTDGVDYREFKEKDMFENSSIVWRSKNEILSGTAVLIVDEFKTLGMLLEMRIQPLVDRVYCACGVWEAQAILKTASITTLLVDLAMKVDQDFFLTPPIALWDKLVFDKTKYDCTKVSSLSKIWRYENPSIESVVGYTRCDIDLLSIPDGVDAFVKEDDICHVLETILTNRQYLAKQRGVSSRQRF